MVTIVQLYPAQISNGSILIADILTSRECDSLISWQYFKMEA